MTDIVGHNAGEHLRSYIERVERLEEEKKELQTGIREVYAEAKADGFDPKAIREIIKERRMEPDARQERQELLDMYRRALGMLSDTPLGEAAMERAAQ